jgi:hypothetical protein
MGSPFQDINKVAQLAISSARQFIEGSDGEFTPDDLDEWLTTSFDYHDFNEIFREMYDETLKAAVNTYLMIEGDEDRLGLIRSSYNLKSISFIHIGKEILSDSPTVQTVVSAHETMETGLKVVGFGLFGLFAIRQFTK